MRYIKYYSRKHFEKFGDKPLNLKPFNQNLKIVADKTISELAKIFQSSDYDIFLLGSTAFKIAGLGDIDIAIVPKAEGWKQLITKLKNLYGIPEKEEKDYVSFFLQPDKISIEAFSKDRGKQEKKLLEFMLSHPLLIREYEDIKKKYAYSKKDYKYQKYKYFLKIKKLLPE